MGQQYTPSTHPGECTGGCTAGGVLLSPVHPPGCEKLHFQAALMKSNFKLVLRKNDIFEEENAF